MTSTSGVAILNLRFAAEFAWRFLPHSPENWVTEYLAARNLQSLKFGELFQPESWASDLAKQPTKLEV